MTAKTRLTRRRTRTSLRSALQCVSMAGMLTAAMAVRAQVLEQKPAREVLGMRLENLLALFQQKGNPAARDSAIEHLLRKAKRYGQPIVEDSTVLFFYYGKARRVSAPGDLNGWHISEDTLTRVPGTDFFYLARKADPRSRFEYKLAVDSVWILDPANTRQAMGGFGPNSEVWMPRYSPPEDISYREGIRHGSLDTLSIRSKTLGRTHPAFVYRPHGFARMKGHLPVVFVTDGGEYLSHGLMHNVLDNLIAEKRIRPIVAIFIDPRTDIRNSGTSRRMTEYAMSDTFVTFLINDVRARLMKKYRLTSNPGETAVMGASLGGLIAAYASYRRPDVFGLCAAQSPSFWVNHGAVIRLFRESEKKPIRFYIDTGTIRDSQAEADEMRTVLLEKGYTLHYAEYPEGHNWANWRARIADILTTFWARPENN
jgi:enterochelin esterase-like enzyme